SRNGGGILQRHPHDLGRIDNPGGDHVLVFARLCIKAEIRVALVGELADHDRAFDTGILRDLPHRRLDGLADDLDTDLLVVVGGVEAGQNFARKEQRNTAAGHDTFLDRSLGRVHGVIDAILALLHLDLGAAADADDRYATGELSQTLLKLFAVVIGGRLLDLRLDLIDAGKDVVLFAGAIDDRCVLLLDAYPLGAAEHLEGHVLELGAQVVRDQLTTGQGRDVLEHGLAAIAEPRR